MAYLSAYKRRDVLFLSLNSSSPVHSVWLGTRTQAGPGRLPQLLALSTLLVGRPWRDSSSELIGATECLDLTGHRTGAVDSQQLGGTITQARAAVAALSFSRQVIE